MAGPRDPTLIARIIMEEALGFHVVLKSIGMEWMVWLALSGCHNVYYSRVCLEEHFDISSTAAYCMAWQANESHPRHWHDGMAGPRDPMMGWQARENPR